MSKAETAVTTPASLPSIFELGRTLIALQNLGDAPDSGNYPEERKNTFSRRHDAVRDLIMTLPAVTLADAAAQLASVWDVVCWLKNAVVNEPEREVYLDQINRALISILPIVTSAAGLPLEAIDGGYGLDEVRDGMFDERRAAEPDAELIQLCDRLAAIDAEHKRLFETIKDDDERDAAFEPFSAEWWKIRERIIALGLPKTLSGAKAMAKAAPLNVDTIEGRDGPVALGDQFGEWAALSVCAFLTGGKVPAHQWPGDKADDPAPEG